MLISISKQNFNKIRDDLARPHPFAFERVGFVFIKPDSKNTINIIDYLSVPDEFYINNPKVGAEVDHRAIVMAMKRADHNNEGVLQVHEHGGKGIPKFSRVDIDSHPVYLRSFRNANPRATHGFLLLSEDSMVARVWKPGSKVSLDTKKFAISKGSFFSWLTDLFTKRGNL
ncbi:hypothetical protein ABES03_10260 [Neobacillus rhizosphaerae]|uniref:hypothetical protein n=1 Tax=Neobacillus rhizosphaerae TaxID=2880965 RepID=UPI003D2A1298